MNHAHVSNSRLNEKVNKRPRAEAPISVGTGLVALDWLLIGRDRVRPNETYAGGSCGNVMSILAYLGWQSYPVARIGRDRQGVHLLADLHRWKVHTKFLLRESEAATPIIIVRLKEDKSGSVTRRYEWRHPASGEWLPRYRPVLKSLAESLSPRLPHAKLFYFDRVEPSSLLLAKSMSERGAVVFFEPSSIKNEALFSSCLAVSDIVKYSAERFSDPPRNPVSKSPKLEIQTFGASGLRYRLKCSSTTPGPWKELPAIRVDGFRDDTGCGDWCSAGVIHQLCGSGRNAFLELEARSVEEGIRFGQSLAAINCEFEGARGPMYHLAKDQLLEVARLKRDQGFEKATREALSSTLGMS